MAGPRDDSHVHRTTKISFIPSLEAAFCLGLEKVDKGGKASWRKRHWTEMQSSLRLAGWEEWTPGRRWSKCKHVEVKKPGSGDGGAEIWLKDGENTGWSILGQTQMARPNTRTMVVRNIESLVMLTEGLCNRVLVTFLCTPLPHAEASGQNHVSTIAQGNVNFQTSFKESNDWQTERANFQGATSETAETSSLDFFLNIPLITISTSVE